MSKGEQRAEVKPARSVRFDTESLKIVANFRKKTGLDFSNAIRLIIRKFNEFQSVTR